MGALKEKIARYGVVGGIFSTIGGLGAFGVCHTICQALVIGLATMGITIIGMPLAFLQEPWFIGISFGVGALFLGMAGLAYLKHEAPSSLRSGYLLRSPRRERNPAEAKNASLSSTDLRPWFFAKADKKMAAALLPVGRDKHECCHNKKN